VTAGEPSRASRAWSQRAASSAALLAALLAMFLLPDPAGLWFGGVVAALATGTSLELYAMFRRRGFRPAAPLGTGAGLLLAGGLYASLRRDPAAATACQLEQAVIALFLGACLMGAARRKDLTEGLRDAGVTALGFWYGVWPLTFLLRIVFGAPTPGAGRTLLLLVVGITKLMDSGAFVVGSLIGRRPICPRISPKKTWEGTLGGVAVATLGGRALFELLRGGLGPTGVTGLDVWLAAPLLAAAAFAGDLAGSLVKRVAGVKDSGRLFPGIGGLLDLVDSLLFTLPLAHLLMLLHH